MAQMLVMEFVAPGAVECKQRCERPGLPALHRRAFPLHIAQDGDDSAVAALAGSLRPYGIRCDSLRLVATDGLF
jgi:hypothetical protein